MTPALLRPGDSVLAAGPHGLAVLLAQGIGFCQQRGEALAALLGLLPHGAVPGITHGGTTRLGLQVTAADAGVEGVGVVTLFSFQLFRCTAAKLSGFAGVPLAIAIA